VVDLTRFERVSSTFAESRSDSAELQVQKLAEGTGLEPASVTCAVVFKSTALPIRLPFQKVLVHVVGLAPTKDHEVRLIYSQAPLLLGHTCK
jgi:hypothetical protein